MGEEEFLAALTGRSGDLHLAVEALRATGQPFCLIGGLAVKICEAHPEAVAWIPSGLFPEVDGMRAGRRTEGSGEPRAPESH